MTHSERTVKGPHRKLSSQFARERSSFSSDRYLEELMAELDRAAISVRMAEARDRAGLTQPELAELLLVHFRTVQDWESPKKHVIPFDRVDEWARLTQTTREWLLYGDEADAPQNQAAMERLEAVADLFALGVERLEAILERLEQLRDEQESG